MEPGASRSRTGYSVAGLPHLPTRTDDDHDRRGLPRSFDLRRLVRSRPRDIGAMNALFVKGDRKEVIRRIPAPKGGIDPATSRVN